MRDILPDEVELRDAAVREIVAVYRAYGFRRIETPALESLRLLAGSDGGDNDVLWLASPLVEIELILATTDALARLGLSGLTVRINDRRLLELVARHCGFPEAAQAAFFIAFDKLDRLGAAGVLAELREGGHDADAVRRFEALLPGLSAAEVSLEGLRAALPGSAEAAWESLATIIATANAEIAAGCRVRFDPTLVRGMGYYTGPIFEIAAPGYASSIAGGGRYDRMIGLLLGREVPASGFSIGL